MVTHQVIALPGAVQRQGKSTVRAQNQPKQLVGLTFHAVQKATEICCGPLGNGERGRFGLRSVVVFGHGRPARGRSVGCLRGKRDVGTFGRGLMATAPVDRGEFQSLLPHVSHLCQVEMLDCAGPDIVRQRPELE